MCKFLVQQLQSIDCLFERQLIIFYYPTLSKIVCYLSKSRLLWAHVKYKICACTPSVKSRPQSLATCFNLVKHLVILVFSFFTIMKASQPIPIYSFVNTIWILTCSAGTGCYIFPWYTIKISVSLSQYLKNNLIYTSDSAKHTHLQTVW